MPPAARELGCSASGDALTAAAGTCGTPGTSRTARCCPATAASARPLTSGSDNFCEKYRMPHTSSCLKGGSTCWNSVGNKQLESDFTPLGRRVLSQLPSSPAARTFSQKARRSSRSCSDVMALTATSVRSAHWFAQRDCTCANRLHFLAGH